MLREVGKAHTPLFPYSSANHSNPAEKKCNEALFHHSK